MEALQKLTAGLSESLKVTGLKIKEVGVVGFAGAGGGSLTSAEHRRGVHQA